MPTTLQPGHSLPPDPGQTAVQHGGPRSGKRIGARVAVDNLATLLGLFRGAQALPQQRQSDVRRGGKDVKQVELKLRAPDGLDLLVDPALSAAFGSSLRQTAARRSNRQPQPLFNRHHLRVIP